MTTAASRKQMILVVDDDHDLLEILKESLESERRHVLVAPSAVDALKTYLAPVALRQNPIDVVLSDMKMPEMSGLEFLIATRSRCPHATFLVLTGYAEKFKMFLAMKYGAYDFVEKPYQFEMLNALVDEGVGLAEREAYFESQLPERILSAGFSSTYLPRLRRKIERVARLLPWPSVDGFVETLLAKPGIELQLNGALMAELKRCAEIQLKGFLASSEILARREDPKILPELRRLFHYLGDLKKASYSLGLEDLGQNLQIFENIVLYLRGFPQMMTGAVFASIQSGLLRTQEQIVAAEDAPEELNRLSLLGAGELQALLDKLESQVVGLL